MARFIEVRSENIGHAIINVNEISCIIALDTLVEIHVKHAFCFRVKKSLDEIMEEICAA